MRISTTVPAKGAGNLDLGLVGLDNEKRLSLGDLGANLDLDLADDDFVDGVADLGHLERGTHL